MILAIRDDLLSQKGNGCRDTTGCFVTEGGALSENLVKLENTIQHRLQQLRGSIKQMWEGKAAL